MYIIFVIVWVLTHFHLFFITLSFFLDHLSLVNRVFILRACASMLSALFEKKSNASSEKLELNDLIIFALSTRSEQIIEHLIIGINAHTSEETL